MGTEVAGTAEVAEHEGCAGVMAATIVRDFAGWLGGWGGQRSQALEGVVLQAVLMFDLRRGTANVETKAASEGQSVVQSRVVLTKAIAGGFAL